MKHKLNVQLVTAVILTFSGLTMLFMGFWVDPTGKIDNSVLVAFGEISTFAGALFGVDYTYKIKYKVCNSKEKEEKHEVQ